MTLRRLFRSRHWYRFSRNPLSLIGLLLVLAIVLAAVFAPWVSPFPAHAGPGVDFANASQPPGPRYWFGTDLSGRDELSRIIFGYRVSLAVGVIVLSIAVPIGVLVGLIAGFYRNRVETALMRITDVFLSVPPLVLALAILGVLAPSLRNAMVAIAAMWWPWYARLIFSITRTLAGEGYVVAARVVGASDVHVLIKEVLPNCLPSLLTKMTLDLGFVILTAASLGFLGLGVQAPTPELGSMVAEGAQNLPDLWWMSVFPGLAILVAVLGFNLLGDGLRDLMDVEV
jgi:peptide/nickel transport system permease protein